MKKLMVAIAAAAISFAGFADDTNNWFTAGFGAEALSSGGVWSPAASSLTWGDENVLLLEDVEAAAPVVFAADEAKAGASTNDDTTVVFDTTVTFQGFDELPAIDANAKAGVCALTDGNYYVVAYDDVGSTNKWVDTGIGAAFDVAVNVKVTVANGKAVYTFTDQFGTDGTDPLDLVDAEFKEVCYSGNGSVNTLAADTILAGVAITLPTIDGLKVTCDKVRAGIGDEVTLSFEKDTKFPSIPSAKYTVGADGTLTLGPGESQVEALDPGAKIGAAIYLTFAEAYEAASEDYTETITLCAGQYLAVAGNVIDKSVDIDLNGNVLTNNNALSIVADVSVFDGVGTGVLELDANISVDDSDAILNLVALDPSAISGEGVLTGADGEGGVLMFASDFGSPNANLARFGTIPSLLQIELWDEDEKVAVYLGNPDGVPARFVRYDGEGDYGEVAYALIARDEGASYVDSFNSVQEAINASDAVYLCFDIDAPITDEELTFKPSTVVYADTGEDDLVGVDLLPTGEVVFDGSRGDYGAWVYSGEPPVVDSYEVSWTGAENAEVVAQVGGEPIDSGDEVEDGKEVNFVVTPNTGYVFAEAPYEGWQITEDGNLTCTIKVDGEAVSLEIPSATEIPATTVQISLSAGVEGYSYIVSNVTAGIAIDPVSSLPGGETYELPIGARIEIYCVAADGYRVTGTNPYVIDSVTTETVIDDANLPKAQAAAAKIGTVLYLTLQDAINAAETDDTVTLLKDVSEKITIAAGKQLTLDLNEKTLTGTDANYVINNLGTLVITGNGVVDSTAVSHNTLIRNGETGVMTIENGTFKSARITVKNDEDGKGVYGQLTINGGTFLASSEQGAEVWDSVQNWGVATINDGEFDGYIECRAESTWNAGVMTITGGTFQKPVQTVVVFDSTHNAADNAADVALTIKGGTFNDMVMRVADVKAKAGEAANVRVDFDESMPEYVASCETLGTVTIPGKVDDELNPAIFANDESVYCEAGYETKDLGDGKYGVEEIVYVAQVGTDKFETLAAAVTAATDGQTITVLDNLELTESIEVEGKDITFDLNGKTLTFNVSGDGFYFFNDADCSVKNGTIVMNVPATANWYSAIYFEDAGGLVKDVTINSGNCKYGVVTGVDDYESLEGTADKTVVCENVDVTGSGLLFYAEAEKMTLDAYCSATQIGTNPAGATYSDALAAGWLGQLTVNGGAYTAEANVVGTMSSPATITLNAGTYTGNFNYIPVSEGYKEMGDHLITKAEAVELDAPEGFMWSAAVEGMQTLVKPMFMIGETGYASWAEAAAAAKEGDTIKVGANAVIPNPGGVLTGSVPVDLCGQSLTFQGGWLTSGSFTFVDSDGGGVLSMANGLNCSATLDLSGLSGEQVVGINGNIKVNSSNSLVKFPEDWDLDTCKKCVNTPADGARIVVQGVTYTYNATKKLWVPEGCYFITITDPENGTLETSATNAVPAGTTVTVTATPDDGYQLVSITTNGEAIVGTEFVMPEGDVTVAATFEAAQSSWDIPGGEGGINALVKEDGTKYVEFTSITFTETGATVGLKAAKIAAQAETFGLVCKTDLTKADTFVINASLSVAEGDPDAKNGLFTIVADDLSDYDQLFVVGVGPAAVTE